jgi:putative membrane protein
MMWNGYGMGYGMGFGWFGPFHFIVPLVITGLIIWAIVAAVRASGGDAHHWRGGRLSPGLDALDERYAKGEINRDEYMQKRRDILG